MTKLRPQSLSLTMPQPASPISSAVNSPSEPNSPTASPDHPQDVNEQPGRKQDGANSTRDTLLSWQKTRDLEASTLTSLPSVPPSPKNVPKHGASRSLFGNLKATKSSNKVHKLETTIRQVSEDLPRDNTNGVGPSLYSLDKSPGSTPELSLSTLNTSSLDIPGGKCTRFVILCRQC